MDFVLATRNRAKVDEILAILGGISGLRIASLDQLELPPAPDEDAIEVYDTFRENAIAKAHYFARRTGLSAIADDSGLRVDALAGAPGVRSKRFAADAGRSSDAGDAATIDELNNALLLERLSGLPADRRMAHFICAAAIASPDRTTCTAIGTCSGLIAPEPRGTRGFGYDPVFLLPDVNLTFGEVDAGRKNARSHRARAFRALAVALASFRRGHDPAPG